MSLSENMACPVCHSWASRVIYQGIPDRSPLHLSGISICACGNCNHRFLLQPPAELLRTLYSEDTDCYSMHEDETYVRRKTVFSKLMLLLIRGWAKQGGRLLELGCGTGLFLDAARQFGFTTFGIEPSGWQADVARNRNHLVWSQAFEDWDSEGQRFDVIVGIEVIEHVLDLSKFMDKLARVALPGALVYLATGSTQSFMATLRGSRWRYYEALHAQYFSPQSIKRLLGDRGWRVLSIGSGFLLRDLLQYGRSGLSLVEIGKSSLSRIKFGDRTRFGMHAIAVRVWD